MLLFNGYFWFGKIKKWSIVIGRFAESDPFEPNACLHRGYKSGLIAHINWQEYRARGFGYVRKNNRTDASSFVCGRERVLYSHFQNIFFWRLMFEGHVVNSPIVDSCCFVCCCYLLGWFVVFPLESFLNVYHLCVRLALVEFL